MQKVSKACRRIFSILLYVLLAAVISAMALYLFGIKPFVTMSGSMEPHIKTGSVCFVNTKADYAEVSTGDIIAFKAANDVLVTHRVVSITDEGVETKGDNNDNSDGITTNTNNFEGETLFSIPYIGYGLVYLQQPAGKIMIAVVIAALLLFNIIDHIFDQKGKEEGANDGSN